MASLGLKIIVTELDVLDWELPANVTRRDTLIAQIYERFLSVVLPHPAVVGVLTWGLSDRYTWLRTYAARADRLPVRPLPLDESFRPKLAYTTIAGVRSGADAEWVANRTTRRFRGGA